MKKILFTISVVASSVIGAMAQSPDFTFETWNNVQFSTTIQDPQGWASLNTLNVFTATPKSVFKETTSPFGGTASAKITTVKVTGALIPNPYQSGDIDTAGLLTIGQIITSPSPGIKYGYNYTWRSQTLTFQSMYTPMAGDSAFVLATLTKWNGTSRDTIASGKYATGATTTSYSLNSITLTYDPAFATVVPDSQQIFISSSVYNHDGAKIGSTFYIDDFAWSGYNSTDEINGTVNNVFVYPNPATNNISITSSIGAAIIRITDITGRLIGDYSMANNEANIQTSTFAAGIYIYSVLDQKKNVLNRGRFEITK